jgi:hypothetical protein
VFLLHQNLIDLKKKLKQHYYNFLKKQLLRLTHLTRRIMCFFFLVKFPIKKKITHLAPFNIVHKSYKILY